MTVPATSARPIPTRPKGRPPARERLRSRSPAHLEGLARSAVESGWWTGVHRDMLDLVFHAGVMTLEQIARLFYAERPNPPRRAQTDARRLFKAHLLDYTAGVSAVLDDLGLPPSKAVCLGRAGTWLVANQNDLVAQALPGVGAESRAGRSPRAAPMRHRAWSVLRPAYLAHNLMLAELVVRVLQRDGAVQFAGELASSLSRAKKVTIGRQVRTVPRSLLRPDGMFRFPNGAVALIEVERARRYDFQRVLEKVRRYDEVRRGQQALWRGRWRVEAFPPVLVLALNAERHVERLREEAGGNRVGFLFRAWDDFLRGDDPLDGWRLWSDGRVVRVGRPAPT